MCPKVLIVEDDLVTAKAYEMLLAAHRCEVWLCSGIQEAMNLCRGNWPGVVLLDIELPIEDITGIGAWDGLDFLAWVRGMTENPPPVYVISSDAHPQTRVRAIAAGAFDFFSKPASKQQLLGAVFRGVQQTSPALIEGTDSQTQSSNAPVWILKEDQVSQRSSNFLGRLLGAFGRR